MSVVCVTFVSVTGYTGGCYRYFACWMQPRCCGRSGTGLRTGRRTTQRWRICSNGGVGHCATRIGRGSTKTICMTPTSAPSTWAPTSQKFQALIAAVDEFVFAHDKRPFEKAVLGDDAIVNEEAEAKMRQDIESSDVRHWSQCPTNRDWTRASYVALMDGAVVRMGLTVDNFSGPHLTGAANPPVHRHPSVSDHA